MNIELSDECFVDMLLEKYKFDTDEEGKVKVVFDKLSIEELISLFNRYIRVYNNDGVIVKDNGDGTIFVKDGDNFERNITYDFFRGYFRDEVEPHRDEVGL